MDAVAAPGGLDPLYYLENFQIMLDTLMQRDADLLSPEEREFVRQFQALPRGTRALLVRLAMRKGPLFRASRLKYPEIDDIGAAAADLKRLGWIEDCPMLAVEELFQLFSKAEIAELLGLPRQCRKERKETVLAGVRPMFPERRRLQDWGSVRDTVYRFEAAPLCLRLRLMFFGNFRQDLKEFVLADLGIFKYESRGVRSDARPFATRGQVEAFHALYRCRELLREGADPSMIETALPPRIADLSWLEERREKLRLDVARAHEKAGNVTRALEIYNTCPHPQARIRAARGDAAGRRVRRRGAEAPLAIPQFELRIARADPDRPVERVAAERLIAAAGERSEVFFVENALINSLFGLLCWRALFAPVPGAFFHRFHRDPADLLSAGFVERRRGEFTACFSELQAGTYKDSILRRFVQSHGIASSFVAWALIDESLLRTALECFPAAHLHLWFEWILQDLRAHRSGFPDLVQFFPRSRRYRLIEVKAPGDKLQDSQRACLGFMLTHGMPVSVCRVRPI